MADLLTEAVPALKWLGLKVALWESGRRMWVGDEVDDLSGIFLGHPDRLNAEARDLILYALEANEFMWAMGNAAGGFDQRVYVTLGKQGNEPRDDIGPFYGSTLTEAVLKAAVAAHKESTNG